MKKLLCFISSLTVLLSVFSAASVLTGLAVNSGSSVLGVSSKSPDIGDTVTVTVTVRADEEMYAIEGYVSFDSSVLQYESGTSANLVDGKVKLVGTPGGAKSQTFTLNFKAVGAGKSTVSLANTSYVGNTEINVSGSSFVLEVKSAPETATPPESSATAPTASSDASLTTLTVGDGALSPAFNPDVTSYTVTVENSISKTTLTAAPASGASVSGTGSKRLSVGDNKYSLTVTAADGKTKKTYTVVIRRLAESESEPTVSEPTADAPQQTEDSLAVIVDDAAYHISTDLSSLVLPEGFSVSSSSYSGIPVPVYEDAKAAYTLFGLTSDTDGTTDFYTYSSETDSFSKLKYAYIDGSFFIFPGREKNTSAPEGFFEKRVEIAGITVEAYAYEDALLTDFAVIYCYHNGKYSYYRYDTREETLQRCPDFKPDTATDTSTDNTNSSSFGAKLNNLSARAKLVLLAVIIAVLCAVALIILLIVHTVSEHRAADSAFSDDSTFDYSFDDAIPFDSVEELSDNNNPEDSNNDE